MTATLTQVRQALAEVLATIPGLRTHAFPKGAINPPAAIVMPEDGEILTYATTMSGTHDLDLQVTVFVQWGENETATEALDAYITPTGDHSVFATVEANQSLGDLVDSCLVINARNSGKVTYAGADYFAADFGVRVLL